MTNIVNGFHLLCIIYPFDTKYLLHRLVADIDVPNLNRLEIETIFYGVKPFPAVMFPMDQGCTKTKNKRKENKN